MEGKTWGHTEINVGSTFIFYKLDDKVWISKKEVNSMKERRVVRLLGVLAICLICLWTVGGNVRAAEQGKATGEVEKKKVFYDAALRRHFKNMGCYLGKSKHCYYTYAQNI